MAIQLELGLDVIRSYRRLSYTPWHALAEFVDNSTQAYFNNREILDANFSRSDGRLEVAIVYDREKDLVRISDNSIGMSWDELAHALRVGAPPANTSGRSKFGLGLKTAACWLGNKWSVRTKKLGESVEHTALVDVETVAGGQRDLPSSTKENQDPSQHYTVVEITQLHRRFHGKTLSKIKQFLGSMYRQDIRSGILDLLWQGVRLDWQDSDERFVMAADGSRYKKTFEFEVNGKRVTGWVGVLDFGHSGRSNAGFSILHAGRVVKGWPESWRPEEIFGQIEGSNDLINQRITGEINLDAFEVSHTKDDILWLGDEEAEVQRELKKACSQYLAVARDRRRRDSRGTGGPSDLEVKTALSELQNELSSAELADVINLEVVPPPEVVKKSLEPVLASVARREPAFGGQVGSIQIAGFLVADGSPNDPYVAVDSTEDNRVVIAVNMRHPYLEEISGAEGMLNYLRHCTYDAVAEWEARHKTSAIDPDTIKALKDRLLRLPSQIEVRSAQSEDTAMEESAGL